MEKVLLLLIAFQLKHFLADYPLQGPYMLGKFAPKFRDFAGPLAAHAGVHALLTGLICSVYGFSTIPLVVVWALMALDFSVHFVVDRIKASPRMLGRFKPNQRYFWWSLGADQMAHHLTHYAIIAALVR